MTSSRPLSLLNVRGRVLLILAIHGPKVTQAEIASQAGVHFQHVNRALKELTAAGLLTRKRVGRRSFYRLVNDLSECSVADATLIARAGSLDSSEGR